MDATPKPVTKAIVFCLFVFFLFACRFIKFISEFLRRVLKSIKRVEKGDCTEKEKLSGEFQEDCVVEGKFGREGEEDGKQKETTDDDCDGETE